MAVVMHIEGKEGVGGRGEIPRVSQSKYGLSVTGHLLSRDWLLTFVNTKYELCIFTETMFQKPKPNETTRLAGNAGGGTPPVAHRP